MLHDYLRDMQVLSYNEYKSCGNRTQSACVRCGYCYSCHWKKENLARLGPLVMSNPIFLEKYPQPAIIEQSHRQQMIAEQHEQQEQKIIDVFGQKTEPICNYHTCHHKFFIAWT